MDYQTIIAGYWLAILLAIILHFWLSHVVAKAAERKGRSYAAFFFISLFFSWILAFIIVATIAEPTYRDTGEPTRALRLCPFCDEPISINAIVCKHCSRDVEPTPSQSDEDENYAVAPMIQASGAAYALSLLLIAGSIALLFVALMNPSVPTQVVSLILCVAFGLLAWWIPNKSIRNQIKEQVLYND